MKLVLVEWEDATVVDEGTWVDRSSAEPSTPVIFYSVGWLYELTADAVTLTDTANANHMAPRDRIPMGMVRKLVEFDPEAGTPVPIPKRKRKR